MKKIKAEDTVLSEVKIRKLVPFVSVSQNSPLLPMVRAMCLMVARKQNRISFKAGQEEERRRIQNVLESHGSFDHQDSAYSKSTDHQWYFSLYILSGKWKEIFKPS